MAISEETKLQFEDWADKRGFCLDQLFMSTAGVPDNPYEDNDTKLAFDIWIESRQAAGLAV